MPLFSIIKKEMRLILSSRLALLLVIAYPVLVTIMLGISFQEMEVKKINTVVIAFVPDSTASFDRQDFIQRLEGKEDIAFSFASSAEEVKKIVRAGQSRVGFVVFAPEQKNTKVKIDVYYDNSNYSVSSFVGQILLSILSRMGAETAKKTIDDVWKDMDAVDANLQSSIKSGEKFSKEIDTTLEKLETIDKMITEIRQSDLGSKISRQKSQIETARQSIQDIKSQTEQLSSITDSLSAVETSLSSFKASVSTFKQQLQSANNSLSALTPQLNNALSSLQQSSTALSQIKTDLDTRITQIDSVINSTKESSTKQALASIKIALQTDSNQLLTIISGLNQIQTSFQSLSSTLQSISSQNASALSQLNSIESSLNDMTASLSAKTNELRNSSNSSNASVQKIQSIVDESVAQITGIESTFNSQKDNITKIGEDLNESRQKTIEMKQTQQDLNKTTKAFLDSIKSLKKYSTDYLSLPFDMKKKDAFEEPNLAWMIPSSLAVILMLSGILLAGISVIIEREQGAILRQNFSQTGRLEIQAGKMIGQLAFSGAAAILMLITALFFGVAPIISIDFVLAIVLCSLAFISIGLLLTVFTQNETNFILSSLIVLVPSIMLSGIVFPLDFIMLTPIKTLFELLPLKVTINLLLQTGVNAAQLSNYIPQASALFLIFAICSITYLVKGK